MATPDERRDLPCLPAILINGMTVSRLDTNIHREVLP